MKIDIVPLVVLVFCAGVAVSALFSSDLFSRDEAAFPVAQVQKQAQR